MCLKRGRNACDYIVNRRGVLSGAGLAITASFAGCLSTLDRSGNPDGTATLPIRFWLEPVSLSPSEQDAVDPIVFGALSMAEQEIVQTALEEGEYTVEQGAEPPALEELRGRVEQRTGNGQTLEAYLQQDDTYHRVGFADGDHIIAHPDR